MISATKLGKLKHFCDVWRLAKAQLPWQKAKDLVAWLSLAAFPSRCARVHKCDKMSMTVESEIFSTQRQLKKLLMMVLMRASCNSRSKDLECENLRDLGIPSLRAMLHRNA